MYRLILFFLVLTLLSCGLDRADYEFENNTAATDIRVEPLGQGWAGFDLAPGAVHTVTLDTYPIQFSYGDPPAAPDVDVEESVICDITGRDSIIFTDRFTF